MKQLFFGAALGVSIAFGAMAADMRDVKVVNGTGYGIKFLGFNNPGDDDWSDNELGDVLANGASVLVKFNTADEGCVCVELQDRMGRPGLSGGALEGRRPVPHQRSHAGLRQENRHDVVLRAIAHRTG